MNITATLSALSIAFATLGGAIASAIPAAKNVDNSSPRMDHKPSNPVHDPKVIKLPKCATMDLGTVSRLSLSRGMPPESGCR
jgi:hypothetical protein